MDLGACLNVLNKQQYIGRVAGTLLILVLDTVIWVGLFVFWLLLRVFTRESRRVT